MIKTISVIENENSYQVLFIFTFFIVIINSKKDDIVVSIYMIKIF